MTYESLGRPVFTSCRVVMHHSGPKSNELGVLPAMDQFSGLVSLPEIIFDFSHPSSSGHQRGPPSNSWERRCLRKHRKRNDDNEYVAKRRKLVEEGAALSESSSPADICSGWTLASSCPSLSVPAASPPPPHQEGVFPQNPPAPGRLEAEGSCMEVDAAQRRLREIEDRITLEDDDDDEDLDVEPFPRRPVLVMSESLRQGLQRGMSDILPHKVAQSVNHSCMELVLWRPPDDALSRRLKDSLQRQQRKNQTASRQPPPPCPSPGPPSAPPVVRPAPAAPYRPAYSFPEADPSGEEDMEL
ncbi:coiled-coil domain-containing protein 117 isoform X2 [Gadus morhua]|uniref:coiled-coil domain-containing protein 117 isoform X2 n=2 Tax=Gadus morhua TaxID=8049 RepID=UPI0011B5D253|nr:coiled-coil domain-containing protein 117 isoform X2 [Gadus morhua]